MRRDSRFSEEQDATITRLWLKDTNCKLICEAIGVEPHRTDIVISRAKVLGLPRRKTGQRPHRHVELKAMKVGETKFVAGADDDEAQRIRVALRKAGIKYTSLRQNGGYSFTRLA